VKVSERAAELAQADPEVRGAIEELRAWEVCSPCRSVKFGLTVSNAFRAECTDCRISRDCIANEALDAARGALAKINATKAWAPH
jgi:hypothetical protein